MGDEMADLGNGGQKNGYKLLNATFAAVSIVVSMVTGLGTAFWWSGGVQIGLDNLSKVTTQLSVDVKSLQATVSSLQQRTDDLRGSLDQEHRDRLADEGNRRR